MSGLIRCILREVAERAPFLATSYRELREILRCYASRPTNTPYGFILSGNRCMEAGTFEVLETEVIKALLPRVEVVVNVGANIGYYACLARSHGKHVVAFEPIGSNVRFLLRNVTLNGWSDVEVFPIALSDRQGIAAIYGGGGRCVAAEGLGGHVGEVRWLGTDQYLGHRFGREIFRAAATFHHRCGRRGAGRDQRG